MSAQQTRSTVAADHRSAHPGLPGVPWWGAVLVALAATALGFAFDAGSGDKELTHVFGALYALGCIGAVLAVRQSAVFTAVIQPPLILFGTVPGAYWLFHGATFTGLKAVAINCGYPLIERFPLMAFTSATVLTIGLVRWYLGSVAAKSDGTQPAVPPWLTAAVAALSAKLSAALNRNPAHGVDKTAEPKRATEKTADRRRRPGERPRRTSAAGTERRSASARRTTRSDPPRSRPARPQVGEESQGEYPRRRPRPAQDSARRSQSGQSAARVRRDPHSSTARPAARTSRVSDRATEAAEPPRRRRPASASNGATNGTSNGASNGASNGSAGTHHPVSRVRYRGSDPDDSYRGERRRSPRPRDSGADDWQYDI